MKRENKPAHAGVTRIYLTALAMVSLLSLPVSCTKDDSSMTDVENTGEPVAVRIIPSGIALYGSVTETDESGSTRSIDTKKERIHFLEDFDKENMLETIIESVPEEVAVPTRAVNLSGTTMRVVVCNGEGDIVTQCAYDVTDGVATPQNGQELFVSISSSAYTFHCYSPANTIDTETKKVTVNAGEEFAYNKITQVIDSSTGAATVTIPALKPMMSKIKLTVSSTVFPGEIQCTGSVKGTFATGATADWTLGDAALTSTTAADQLLEFTENNQELTVFSTGVTTGELTLTLADLTIGDETKTAPTLTAASGFTLEAGKRYIVSIEITKKNYITNSEIGLRVAKGNLMKKDGKWQLAPDQGWYSGDADGGDYFSWGLTDPTVYGPSVYGDSMDALTAACVEVLGEGWRVPKGFELRRFSDITERVYSTYISTRGTVNGWYFGTKSAEEAKAKQEEYVFLPSAGNRFSYGSVDTSNAFGNYWGSDPLYYYNPDRTDYGILLAFYATEVIYYDPASKRALNAEAHTGNPIRCVADK